MGKGGCLMHRLKWFRNDQFKLFEMKGDLPAYHMGLGVFRVMWFRNQPSRVIIKGMLPANWYLMQEEGPFTFHLVNMPIGMPPDIYDIGEQVAHFNDCIPRRKWISRPVALSPNDVEYISGYVEFECDIELYNVELWEEV